MSVGNISERPSGAEGQDAEADSQSVDSSPPSATAICASMSTPSTSASMSTPSSSVTPSHAAPFTPIEWKEIGNLHFQNKQYSEAAESYRSGLEAMGVSHSPDLELKVNLLSNHAQALCKLKEYTEAERSCDEALQINPKHGKVLYRRAVVRTSLFHEYKEQKYLIEAKEDLLTAMEHYDQLCKGTGDTKILRLKGDCQKALDGMENEFYRLEQNRQPPKRHNGEASSSFVSLKDPPLAATEVPRAPPALEQKKDIMRLLVSSRQLQGEVQGELYCVIEWQWWCRWCRRVDFFGLGSVDGGDVDSSVVSRAKTILRYFPPGAVLPGKPRKIDADGDIHGDSSTSSNDNDEIVAAPGRIDNSSILMGSDHFSKQWYHRRDADIANGGLVNGTTDAARPDELLKPNLVRGYHYELLPREVFNAFKCWYGEVTPGICRRKTRKQTVVLYPYSRVSSGGGIRGAPSPVLAPSYGSNGITRCAACRAPTGPNKRCSRCGNVSYCDRTCQGTHWPFHRQFCQRQAKEKNLAPSEEDAITDHDEVSLVPLDTHGRVGLSNLGNTCFMNSALQSLSHATPLTRFFLSGRFEGDLNVDNPLGTNGKLADAYGKVMRDLWMKPNVTSISPSGLKRAVAAFAPRFAGYLQHDAQEFLAYLLDGLHEDLNRVRNPPYVEMPDVTDGQNMAIAGAEAWDSHKRRNDSLVLDSFYGQFQSTCVCPKCNQVSVSFDAFNHVSLEIPQGTVTVPVLLHRYEGGSPPLIYGVKIPRPAFARDLALELSKVARIHESRQLFFFPGDTNNLRLTHFLDEKRPVTAVGDIILAFEAAPSNKPATIHIIMHHFIVNDSVERSENELVDGVEVKVDQEVASTKDRGFGIPIMTSLDAPNCTGRDIWEHVWKLVRHLVLPVSTESPDDEDILEEFVDADRKYRPRDILTIRWMARGEHELKPLCVFPASDGKTSSVVPADGDVLLANFLSEGYADVFIYLNLEWKNPSVCGGDEGPLLIDPEKFFAFTKHESYVDYEQEGHTKNGSHGVTLDECFRSFSKPERLDSQNTWYCSNCKEHVRALKTMKIWRLPNILVIHLKRFEFRSLLRRDKLETMVDFPLEGLNMDPYCENAKRNGGQFVDDHVPGDYDLFAVVNHFGRMGFGHYTAFAMEWDETGLSKEWNLFDDSNVRPVQPGDVITPAAYILFYRRRQFN